MTTLDDLETDFESGVRALAEAARREIEAIPEAERPRYFLRQAAARLVRVMDLGAPDCLVEEIEKSLARRLKQRASARRV